MVRICPQNGRRQTISIRFRAVSTGDDGNAIPARRATDRLYAGESEREDGSHDEYPWPFDFRITPAHSGHVSDDLTG